ncbi:MAG: glucosaminidase domain-containing protein [Desulfohalobiaceae bacterium]
MPKIFQKSVLQAVFVFFAAAIFLQACKQDNDSLDAKPEKLIGQYELPSLKVPESERENQLPQTSSQGQGQKDSSSLPSVPEHIDTELPDFSQYQDVQKKKKAFFDFLRPIVQAENLKVLKERAYVLSKWQRYQEGQNLSEKEQQKLQALAKEYRVDSEYADGQDFFRQLLLHMDKIPVSLALIQAAKESGWGTSSFARKGNNLFGQWCFEQGCGIVPRQRPEGASYEIKKFDDVSGSVQAYIQNLNSHPAYQELRLQRYRMRLAGEEPDAQFMAEGLEKYSQIGMKYVDTVQNMIRGNEKFMGLHDSNAES